MRKIFLLTAFFSTLIGLQGFAQTFTLTVSSEKKQTITGFGAAAMESLMRPIQDVDIIRKAYEPTSPIGLNILRMEMSPNTKGDITAADVGWDTPYDWHGFLPAVQEAKKYGALILATPWSPPAAYKTNGKSSGGKEDNVHGKLKTSSYGQLFTWFNSFLTYMQLNNASVDVVSIQNEPDWWVSYSGCEYSPQEMHDLVKQYASRLNKSKFNVRLLGGEPLGFKPDYYRLLMENPETAQYIDLLGGHVYGSYDCKKNLATAVGYADGKEVWMTEHLINPRGDESGIRDLPTWHEQMEFCEDVNECLLNGATAYIYWYLAKEYAFIGDGTQYDSAPCLSEGNVRGEILPRGYIMGQFARNLKGATRLSHSFSLTDGSKTPGVNQSFETSAFLRSDSLIVNVIDTLNREFTLKVNLPYNVDRLHRIQTTEGAICAEENMVIEPGKAFSFTIPGRSFTTYIFHVNDDALAIKPTTIDEPKRNEDAFYSLSGQRVKQPRHGVFIQNGHKVLF